MSDGSIKPPSISNDIYNLSINYVGIKSSVKFNGNCLKQEETSFDYGKVANIYIAFAINKNTNVNSYPTLENCLFGAVKLIKHIDTDVYRNSVYGIGFDRKGLFRLIVKLVEV